MYYVYRIQSLKHPLRHYTGYSADLRQRLQDHNAGKCDYTAPFCPWRLVFYAAFATKDKARGFEDFLKSGSGIAFGKKRLW